MQPLEAARGCLLEDLIDLQIVTRVTSCHIPIVGVRIYGSWSRQLFRASHFERVHTDGSCDMESPHRLYSLTAISFRTGCA